jgi:3-isopropylmalate/(R)-2-methylmalate dehydratase small subunit|tara:strand:+ start:3315 stop:3953 length:639 start_codon:yes stop_codon:yes gene_type:complete
MRNESFFHVGKAVPLDMSNVDTDQIIPKQFLKSIKKTGFGPNLFDSWRYKDEGFLGKEFSERILNEEFILNSDKYLSSSILLSKENFGCGSSREHAVWALRDFGFKCIIAMSFADIFYNNCFKNGLLAIELGQEKIDKLFAFAESGLQVEIDLINQNIHCSDEDLISFEIDEFRKQQILEGLDEVGISLKYSDEIKNFEKQRELEAPWVFKS